VKLMEGDFATQVRREAEEVCIELFVGDKFIGDDLLSGNPVPQFQSLQLKSTPELRYQRFCDLESMSLVDFRIVKQTMEQEFPDMPQQELVEILKRRTEECTKWIKSELQTKSLQQIKADHMKKPRFCKQAFQFAMDSFTS